MAGWQGASEEDKKKWIARRQASRRRNREFRLVVKDLHIWISDGGRPAPTDEPFITGVSLTKPELRSLLKQIKDYCLKLLDKSRVY